MIERTETKAETERRLKKEKRWEEASARKKEKISQLIEMGISRSEASDSAHRWLLDTYPPLPGSESPSDAKEKDSNLSDEGASLTASPLPVDWYKLPLSAPLADEVEWVHQNRVFVVEEKPTGKIVLHYDRARTSPPSGGAINTMQYAATNRKGFMDMLQRVKPGGEQDERNKRREKHSIEDIEEVLEQMQESCDVRKPEQCSSDTGRD